MSHCEQKLQYPFLAEVWLEGVCLLKFKFTKFFPNEHEKKN